MHFAITLSIVVCTNGDNTVQLPRPNYPAQIHRCSVNLIRAWPQPNVGNRPFVELVVQL